MRDKVYLRSSEEAETLRVDAKAGTFSDFNTPRRETDEFWVITLVSRFLALRSSASAVSHMVSTPCSLMGSLGNPFQLRRIRYIETSSRLPPFIIAIVQSWEPTPRRPLRHIKRSWSRPIRLV